MDVLIVDSSFEIIKRLKELLSAIPAISFIHEAASFREASSVLKKIAPAIVLIDTNLPDNKSAELAKKIRSVLNDTTVIAMAIRIDEQLRFQYKSLGVQYLFDKYHEFDKIPEVVENLVRRKPKR